MKILHVAPVSRNKASGLSFSVPNLIRAQNYDSPVALLFNTKDDSLIRRNDLFKYDIIVLHSFFILSYLRLLWLLPKKCMVVICPRGAFSKSNKYSLKKHIYSSAYFSLIKFKKHNYKIHFLTEEEKERSRFRTNKDFVVGNCIKVGERETEKNIERKFGNKTIVYVGRFSTHIKGLDLLFDFLIQNKSLLQKSGYKFKFYGPDNSEKMKLIELITKHKVENVFFNHEIYGDDKNAVYRNATYNILNSRSEGYPMAVLEALAQSTPQLLSKGTNMLNNLLSYNFGYEINSNLIENLINLDYQTYKEQCLSAYSYAQKHDISIIGKETIERYLR